MSLMKRLILVISLVLALIAGGWAWGSDDSLALAPPTVEDPGGGQAIGPCWDGLERWAYTVTSAGYFGWECSHYSNDGVYYPWAQWWLRFYVPF